MKLSLCTSSRIGTVFGRGQLSNSANRRSVALRSHVRVATIAAAITAMCSLAPTTMKAATSTSSMAVSATVVASCTVSTSPMAFGRYSNALLTSTATITATCTNTTPYNVGLNVGTASGATATARSMFVAGTPAVLLNYALYSNSGRTTNWGNTVGTDTVSGTGNGSAQALTVYGQVPAGQLVAPGSYTDTITATITY